NSTVVLYVARPRDVSAAGLILAGRPLVFRAVAGAVRGGASRVLVPSRFRSLLEPALIAAPRVARAVVWLDATTAPPAAAILVPVGAVLGVPAIAALLERRAPAVHAGAHEAGVSVVAAPTPLIAALWPALAAGAPVAETLDKALGDASMTAVHEPSLV